MLDRVMPCVFQLSIARSLEGDRGTESSHSEIKTRLSYAADESKPYVEGPAKPHDLEEKGITDPGKAYGAAKIHDFCFGIPYGE